MDIVEQLRKSANTIYKQDGYTFRLGLQNEAADEIERLRGEIRAWWKETEIMRSDLAIYSEQIERQQKALQWIAGCEGGDIFDMCKEMRDTAKAALKEGE